MASVEEVLKRLRKESDDEKIPSVSVERGQFLRDVVAKKQPHRILEVGSAIGYSTLWMASAMPKDCEIVSVEIDPAMAKRTFANLKAAGFGDRVHVITGDALQILPNLPGPFDLAFLDAVKEDYLTYLQDVEPQLSKGATVVADNAGMFAAAMKPYLDYVRTSTLYRSSTKEFADDKIEVSERTT